MDNQNPIPVPINPAIQTEVITDVSLSTGQFIKTHYKIQFRNIMTLTIILVVGLALLGIIGKQPGAFTLMMFVLIGIPGLFYASMKAKVQQAFMEQFAAANHFNYFPQGLPPGYDGSIFFVGHNQNGQNLITGNYENYPLALCDYFYITGSGKNQETHRFTIFQLDCGTSLPPVFLQSNQVSFGDFIFSHNTKDSKEVELEGDMRKSFHLWTQENFQIEALQVFSPDFLAQMTDKWNWLSLEFVNHHIYIYAAGDVQKKINLDSMYSLAEFLLDKLEPKLKAMAGDVVAMETEKV